jgi:hypothetical protein
MNRRKTVSVTPAMGASTVAGAMLTAPIDKWVGKELMAKFTGSGAGHRFLWPANLNLTG